MMAIFRIGVAVNPVMYLAFAYFITISKLTGREMMAFVNNNVAVSGDDVLHLALSIQALNQNHIDDTRASRPADGDLTD